MATSDDVLAAARAEIGYSRWDDPEQGTKYGRWYADLVGDPYYAANGVPYCAMFVSWVFAQAGATCEGLPGAYCPWMLNAARAAGDLVPDAQAAPGDVVYFDWDGDGVTDHVGIVELNCGWYLQTVEGNTDDGQVLRRTRDFSAVVGVARPTWGEGDRPAPEPPTGELARIVDAYNGSGDNGWRPSHAPSADAFIFKASEGVSFKDWWAQRFADEAADMGRPFGFYHFARTNDARAEAEWFVACCKATGRLAEATLWLDYEADALGNGPGWCREFVDAVNSMTGKRCGIYTSKSVTWEQDFGAIAAHTPLWGAQYADMAPRGWEDSPWQSEGGWGAWGGSVAIHQYTGNGYIDGSGQALDLNRGYVTAEQWAAWVGGAPQPEPEPQPVDVEVDGYWGAETTSAAQAAYGTPVDGEVWHQWPSTAQPGCTTGWQYDRTGEGSALIRAMQQDYQNRGIYKGPVDGLAGPLFWSAFQTAMGTEDDGEIWAPSPAVEEFQRRLNEGNVP